MPAIKEQEDSIEEQTLANIENDIVEVDRKKIFKEKMKIIR